MGMNIAWFNYLLPECLFMLEHGHLHDLHVTLSLPDGDLLLLLPLAHHHVHSSFTNFSSLAFFCFSPSLFFDQFRTQLSSVFLHLHRTRKVQDEGEECVVVDLC
jgi:hypothetical protein